MLWLGGRKKVNLGVRVGCMYIIREREEGRQRAVSLGWSKGGMATTAGLGEQGKDRFGRGK